MAKTIQNNRNWRVGQLHKNGEYRKRVSHWYWFSGRDISGYMFDETELKQLLANKAKVIHLYDTDEKNHYEITFNDCLNHGVEKSGRHGTFYVVSLQHFEQAYKNYPEVV